MYVNQTLGSSTCNNLLSRLGLSVSSDEVTRFRQSVVMRDVDDLMMSSTKGLFTQWSADNIDHNLANLDGLNSFYGMGIISMSSPINCSIDMCCKFGDVPVKREQCVTVDELVAGHGIQLVRYVPQNKPVMSMIHFKPVKELLYPSTLPVAKNTDLLWHVGW